jgi:hypothetical protein
LLCVGDVPGCLFCLFGCCCCHKPLLERTNLDLRNPLRWRNDYDCTPESGGFARLRHLFTRVNDLERRLCETRPDRPASLYRRH